MRFYYVMNARFPTERAHGIQIMKTCEALSRAGADLELIVPTRDNSIKSTAFAYYDIPESFSITYLSVPDTIKWGRVGFFLNTIRFAHAARRYLCGKEGVVYGRDERVLARLVVPGRTVVWESHMASWNAPARFVAAHANRIVAISEGIKEEYVFHGVPTEHIVVAPDGVDLSDFRHALPKAEARTKLGLPADAFIAAYIGKFSAEKGAYTFFAAAENFDAPMLAVAIGGEGQELESLGRRYPCVRFLGPQPYRDLPDNQAIADVIVLPNSASTAVSARFTSPLKLFTAMASGVPIVASDVPSIREVLDDSMAYFVPPDDADALAAMMRSVAQEPDAARAKAQKALMAAQRYTWDTRAHTILSVI